MALTRYSWETTNDTLQNVDFVNNSFGRNDAIIYAKENVEPGALQNLVESLKSKGITAYPDIRDGKQTLVAYGFKKPQDLLASLQQQGLVSSTPVASEQVGAGEKEKSFLRKFVQRYSIRLAAVSGLLGHASMGAISALTGDKKFFGTAWKYTLADAVISLYGTDKSVTADPVMQDFKDYLWKQGMDNSFVKARTDKVSGYESFDKFMKKRSFQIANAFGAMGNLNQIQIGIQDKNTGFLVAGVTSMFGAGLQIFGSEQKRNPEQMKRKGPLSRLFAFIDANPMQIAAATNFTDPFALFYSAYNNKKIEAKNKASNDAELKKHYAILGSTNLSTRDLFAKNGSVSPHFATASKVAQQLNAEHAKKNNIFTRFSFDKEKAARLEAEFRDQYVKLKGENGLDKNDLPIDKFGEKFKSEDVKKAAKSMGKIEDLQAENTKIAKGGKWKTVLLYMVATFYTGATLLRLIARKTATGEENKDAFNEVYAAAAQSLLNIENPDKRRAMMLQMGHYLSTHPKIEHSADVIIDRLRERVEHFSHSPFVQVPQHAATPTVPIAEQEETPAQDVSKDALAEAPTPKPGWTDKTSSQGFSSHTETVDVARQQAEEQAQQPSV